MDQNKRCSIVAKIALVIGTLGYIGGYWTIGIFCGTCTFQDDFSRSTIENPEEMLTLHGHLIVRK